MFDIVDATPTPKPTSNVLLRERVSNTQRKMKAYYDNSNAVKMRDLNPVSWVRIKRPGHISKSSSKFMGPLKIQRKVGANTCELENGSTWNVEWLTPFTGIVIPEVEEEQDLGIPVEQFSERNDQNQKPNLHVVRHSIRYINRPQNIRSSNRPQRNRHPPLWAKDYVLYSKT